MDEYFPSVVEEMIDLVFNDDKTEYDFSQITVEGKYEFVDTGWNSEVYH